MSSELLRRTPGVLRRREPSVFRGVPSCPVASMLPFDPRQIPGLRRWYDAADTSTITSSGSPARVSSWADKSPYGVALDQATAGNQPKTGNLTQNGLNTIEFDATRSDHLKGAFSLTLNLGTVFTVANKTAEAAGTVSNYSRVVTMWNNANTPGSPGDFGDVNSWASIIYNSPALFAAFSPGVTSYRASAGVTGQALTRNVFNVTAAQINLGSVYLWHNGVLTSGTTSTTALNVTELRVGAAGVTTPGDSNMNGPICEVIVYAGFAMDFMQVQQVLAYLKAKWATV